MSQYLIVDTNALWNLAASGGQKALDLLLTAADKVVVPDDVYDEVLRALNDATKPEEIQALTTARDWINAQQSGGQPA
jgi:predicted nucleic acid-binding protein